MTEQYEQESINGRPAPLSLTAIPVAPPVAGLTDNAAIFWPSLPADAVIVGSGIEVVGTAALGTIIQFSTPGLFEVTLVTADAAAGGAPINLLRGAPIAVTTVNGYPGADFTAVPGIEDIAVITAPAPDNASVSATFRITNADLVDPVGGVNPDRQLRFAYVPPLIPTLVPPGTRLSISRVSR